MSGDIYFPVKVKHSILGDTGARWKRRLLHLSHVVHLQVEFTGALGKGVEGTLWPKGTVETPIEQPGSGMWRPTSFRLLCPAAPSVSTTGNARQDRSKMTYAPQVLPVVSTSLFHDLSECRVMNVADRREQMMLEVIIQSTGEAN